MSAGLSPKTLHWAPWIDRLRRVDPDDPDLLKIATDSHGQRVSVSDPNDPKGAAAVSGRGRWAQGWRSVDRAFTVGRHRNIWFAGSCAGRAGPARDQRQAGQNGHTQNNSPCSPHFASMKRGTDMRTHFPMGTCAILEGVSESTSGVTIRLGQPADIDAIRAVELAAGELFRSVGMDQIADDAPPDRRLLRRHIENKQLWVALVANQVAGYCMALPLDANAHLDQISVDPQFGRRGLGAALVSKVVRWSQSIGAGHLSLFTYADVPWNAPYYRSLGFRAVDPSALGPATFELWRRESATDLHNWNRVVMQREITYRSNESLRPQQGEHR